MRFAFRFGWPICLLIGTLLVVGPANIGFGQDENDPNDREKTDKNGQPEEMNDEDSRRIAETDRSADLADNINNSGLSRTTPESEVSEISDSDEITVDPNIPPPIPPLPSMESDPAPSLPTDDHFSSSPPALPFLDENMVKFLDDDRFRVEHVLEPWDRSNPIQIYRFYQSFNLVPSYEYPDPNAKPLPPEFMGPEGLLEPNTGLEPPDQSSKLAFSANLAVLTERLAFEKFKSKFPGLVARYGTPTEAQNKTP